MPLRQETSPRYRVKSRAAQLLKIEQPKSIGQKGSARENKIGIDVLGAALIRQGSNENAKSNNRKSNNRKSNNPAGALHQAGLLKLS